MSNRTLAVQPGQSHPYRIMARQISLLLGQRRIQLAVKWPGQAPPPRSGTISGLNNGGPKDDKGVMLSTGGAAGVLKPRKVGSHWMYPAGYTGPRPPTKAGQAKPQAGHQRDRILYPAIWTPRMFNNWGASSSGKKPGRDVDDMDIDEEEEEL